MAVVRDVGPDTGSCASGAAMFRDTRPHLLNRSLSIRTVKERSVAETRVHLFGRLFVRSSFLEAEEINTLRAFSPGTYAVNL